MEAVLGHVPGARVDAAEHRQQPQRVDTADPGDAVLAVGREGVVLPVHGATGADLRGLLAQQRRPQAQFALPLERDRLVVDAADQQHVAIEALDLLVVAGEGVLGVLDSLPFRCQQLDELDFRAHATGVAHRCILSSRCGGSPASSSVQGAGSPRFRELSRTGTSPCGSGPGRDFPQRTACSAGSGKQLACPICLVQPDFSSPVWRDDFERRRRDVSINAFGLPSVAGPTRHPFASGAHSSHVRARISIR